MYSSIFFIFSFFCIFCSNLYAQDNIATKIDSLIATDFPKKMNGVILIAHKNKIKYQKAQGFADIDKKIPLTFDNQFIIGSVSKQITSVIILQLFDKKLVDLHIPIKKYLPTLSMSWADSVTIHHLLNHTSGIDALDKPLAFSAGTKFAYSNLGYNLLGQIAENVAKKPFETLMNELFVKCKMKNSTSINTSDKKNLSKGYTTDENKILKEEIHLGNNKNIASGFMVSNPSDLLLWNQHLHQGKILSKKAYERMITPSSIRNHPLFGALDYGYGLQMDKSENLFEIGHGGYAKGFATVNFYYPKTKTSIIIIENVDFQDETFKKTFFFETEIRKIIRKNLLILKKK
ncbi:MAG: class A beta-lactamase-related serine hydrolase [Cytophagales bacterium]|nr:MAG: class A beta-lactamase-related serine hydrolase [Cytophagales bacterium]